MSAPRSTAVFLLCAVLIAPAASAGGSLVAREQRPEADLALVSALDVRDELVAAASQPAEAEGRSTGLVTLASLAVPGTGQLLKGETRGYAYLLAEVAFWVAFAALNQEGLDIRDEYEAYARDEWNYEAYVDFYEEYCTDCEGDCPEGCRPLAEYGSQEYYEDIGKYSVYWPWWEIDGDEGVPGAEPSEDDLAIRGDYWGMRKDSNRNLRNARYFMTAAFLNHIVSAADAFLTSRRGGGDDGHAARPGTGVIFDVTERGDGIRCSVVGAF
ncbi:MAG: hypothetical protein GF405_03870 [Candidatus Eisenbacteria bacterium]|nr:hypothetical protein [Candidatus Eisenbacteria bacterium]